MSSDLKNWLKFGWLKEHETSKEEIADLLAVADRDLKACNTPNLHNDWRFNIAYNAALQLASAALAIAGYKAERTNHHYRVIESLAHTLGADAATIVRGVSQKEEHLRLRASGRRFRRRSRCDAPPRGKTPV